MAMGNDYQAVEGIGVPVSIALFIPTVSAPTKPMEIVVVTSYHSNEFHYFSLRRDLRTTLPVPLQREHF
jgi:hypothetical protein